MSPGVLHTLSIVSSESIERFAAIAGAAFANDPFTRRFIAENDGHAIDAPISLRRLTAHFLPLIEHGAKTGAELVQANDWKAIALWANGILVSLSRVPPASAEQPKSAERDVRPALQEYKDQCQQLRWKYLGERRYWCLNIIARNPEATEPGVIRALVDPYLCRAQAAGVPAWLEATNEHASEVYAHLGFELAEVIRLFEGGMNVSGNESVGKEGALLYAMICEPNKKSEIAKA